MVRTAFLVTLAAAAVACVTSTGPEGSAGALTTSDGGTGCNAIAWLELSGVTCPSCKQAVLASLNAVPGVVAAEVTLSPAEAAVQHCDTVDTKDLVEAVKDAGYGARLRE